MTGKKLFVFIVLLLIINNLKAQNECDSLLAQLNGEIANKSYYDNLKEREIQENKRLLNIKYLQPEQEYDFNSKLSKLYQKYIIDSAIFYSEKNLQIASEMRNAYMKIESSLFLSQLYSTAGMYIEANDILLNIDRKTLPETLLPLYFESYSHFYGHYAQSNDVVTYYIKHENYRDSLLMALDTNSLLYKTTYIEKLLQERQFDTAEKQLLDIFEQLTEQNPYYAFVTYLLSNVYQAKQNIELQKKYLALSSIADIKNSIKDNASIQSLALIHYRNNDVKQAYQYMKSAIDDIVFSNMRFRIIELSSIYSVINNSYLNKEAQQKDALRMRLLLISILSFFLTVAVLYVYKQNRKMSKMQKKLYTINQKLTDLNQIISLSNDRISKVNTQLEESNRIKEEYITQFFDLCSTYINKLENYRKMLNRKAINRQHEELFNLLKSTALVDVELKQLYETFDTIFLNLYPTFIEDFYSLISSEEQTVPKILNTELRIFALIRLGITDSIKIAGFLRYSVSTIYNYRTKMRNKAIVSRDKFEEMVMKIGSLQIKN
ncbi:MAG: DUF6377 domain-containing protein [Prevotellaceae bacterium]|jgi:hypothetical protein|nr:DUF6377 domain-containing protein [Prevotellaceae bacterium]